MILLTSTSDKLRLTTAQTLNLDVHASWIDNASGTITPGRTNTAFTSATTLDIVASPAASTQRNVKTLNIRNKSTTTAQTVTVIHTDGTTAVELIQSTLSPGQSLQYVEGQGWQIVSASAAFQIGDLNPSSNLIVNAACDVSQELGTTGATLVNATLKYVIDCFRTSYNHAAATAVFTSAQLPQASFPATLNLFQNCLQLKATTALTSPANGDFAQMIHYIEGYRIAHLGWGTVNALPLVVAFMVHSTVSGVLPIAFFNSNATRSYFHEMTLAAGWNFISFAIPGDTAGSWDVTTGKGIIVALFPTGKEATPVSTLDAWFTSAGGKTQTTNSTNLFATNNNQVCWTGVYIAPGTQPLQNSNDLAKLMRPFGEELRLCQRYLFRRNAGSSTNDYIGTCQAFATNESFGNVTAFPVTMRVAPTMTVSAASHFQAFSAAGNAGNASTVTLIGTVDCYNVNDVLGLSGLVAGNASVLKFNTTNGWIMADARQ